MSVKLTPAQRRLLIRIDAGSFHCHVPAPRERSLVAKLEAMGLARPSLRFGGYTTTTAGAYALGTFTVVERLDMSTHAREAA